MDVQQVRAYQKRARPIDVDMPVVEAGQREGALEIDDLGVRPHEPADLDG